MAAYDELRLTAKLEKYMKFVESGSSEAMRGYGGNEIVDLALSNQAYYKQILDRVILACFNDNWNTRISAVQIYQRLLDIFISVESNFFTCLENISCIADSVPILKEICCGVCFELTSFDSKSVILHGNPLYSHTDEDISGFVGDKSNKKFSAKQILDQFFEQHSVKKAMNSQELYPHSDYSSVSTINHDLVDYFFSNHKLLLDRMVSSVWTERHSSAMCLEANLRILYSKVDQTLHANYSSLLAKVGCYCIVVLLLDKYGDYVSCNVVAPVRESVSQLLGVVVYLIKNIDAESLIHIIVFTLNYNREFEHGWQIVHSCLVATKYILLACRKRQLVSNPQLIDLAHQFFIKSFGSDNSTNSSCMIMDDVLAECCTILMMTSNQFWSSKDAITTSISFIVGNMELLDESCSSLSKVIDLLNHYVNCFIESVSKIDQDSSSNFLTKSYPKIIKFLYSYALISSKEMIGLVMSGSTKLVCYIVNSHCLSDHPKRLQCLFWGHLYYLIYMLLTSDENDGCQQSFDECVAECVRCVDTELLLNSESYFSVLLNLITSPFKTPIKHNEIVQMCPFVGMIFQNAYGRANYIGGFDGPITVNQYNIIAHQRVISLEAIVKLISITSMNPCYNDNSCITLLSNIFSKIINNYQLSLSDTNFYTRSLILSALLYKITSVHDFKLLAQIYERVVDKIRYIIECFLPLIGLQDIMFNLNYVDNKHLLSDINQDIVSFMENFSGSQPQSQLGVSTISNSKTLRQASSFFTSLNSSTLIHSAISKDTVVTIINKLNQLELTKYIFFSRVQLYLILFIISLVKHLPQTATMKFISSTSSWYIIPLMEGVKYEDIQCLYNLTCESLISFIQSSNYSPLEKIFNNIAIYITNSCVTYLPLQTNKIQYSLEIQTGDRFDSSSLTVDTKNGIFAIYYYHYYVNRRKDRKDDGSDCHNIFPISNRIVSVLMAKERTSKNSVQLLTQLFRKFCISSKDDEQTVASVGQTLLNKCINMSVFNFIKNWNHSICDNVSNINTLVNSLLLFEKLYFCLDKYFPDKCVDILENICNNYLCHKLTTVRTLSAMVVARILSKRDPIFAIQFAHAHILSEPMSYPLRSEDNGSPSGNESGKIKELCRKFGLAELVFYVVDLVEDDNTNLLALSLVVHVVKNLMDENYQVSYCYSLVLAQLMKYIHLFIEECTNFIDSDGHAETAEQIQRLPTVKDILLNQLHFMRELSMPSSSKSLKLPFEIANVTLRPYQKDGINWLLFLQNYNLNGALCDDMGLGKTLQTIITIAYTHYNDRNCRTNSTQARSIAPTATLIVCPPILIQHWFEEFLKFLPLDLLKIIKFDDYKQLKLICRQLSDSKIDVLITSYSILRNHIDRLQKYSYKYVVLDEAHLVKNKNSKYYLAIKKLQSKYRLILTGTPIQNNINELWTLFDFLMPNFLGSDKIFSRIYARPILKGFNPKCTSEAFLLAQKLLGNLHKQILPFVLRRTKQTVLDDLPEKIVQTIFCSMSSIQRALYDVLSFDNETNNVLKSQLRDLPLDEKQTPNTHVFKIIHYLRRVCNHPSLALDSLDDLTVKEKIETLIDQHKHSLQDISVASKLVALMELLQQCGIYDAGSKSVDESLEVMPECDSMAHRALIFSQTTTMLDIIESDLLKKRMPNVKYLRLDGSVRQSDRYPITKQFNDDNDISLLLLTTSVGSLGLNLTGADMVIFYENDWNPMKDLQAMDRAHRIGQTKTVNVYRLVIKDTIEEHILNLQNNKLKMVNTIINESNSDLNKMKESDIFDVFGTDSSIPHNDGSKNNAIEEETNIKSLKRSHSKLNYSDHTDFSNGEDYAKQYDLDKFCKNLK